MSNVSMTNEIPMTQAPNKKYDLRERTAKFGEDIINFAKKIPENSITRPIISQLVRAGTSVGANYCEADDASTKRDFFYKIGVCRKESKESKHWLQMIVTATPFINNEAKVLSAESQELNLIFSAIINKRKNK
jgi:four helix bundle protein